MKVFIVSDTHDKHRSLEMALEQVGEIDVFIHLGDIGDGLEHIDAIVDCEKYMIGGNNDFFSSLPREREFLIGNKRVFITHGHKYIKGLNLAGLVEAGRSRGVDIVMFGHTHMPYLERLSDLTLLNPGSISLPRQTDREPSFVLMEMELSGEVKYNTYYLGKDGRFVSLGIKGLDLFRSSD